ncbi:MAG: DUF6489 family protein [Alphaproteobacteria bacterium]
MTDDWRMQSSIVAVHHKASGEFASMKISIDFDATPEEARHFFGLPDIAPMQEALVKEMTTRMQDGLKEMDAEALWRQWMPASGNGGGIDAMRQFWEQAMQGGMPGASKKP